MKKLYPALLAVLFSLPLAAQSGSETILDKGDAVPAFTVTMTDGSTINIADLKGKVVLLNFWATWCPPCRAELARVQEEIVDRFEGRDFVFLPISRGEDLETVLKFRGQTGYTFNMGIDPESEIFPLFAESGIPRNYLIGRDGVIAGFELGYSPDIFTKLIAEIEDILNK